MSIPGFHKLWNSKAFSFFGDWLRLLATTVLAQRGSWIAIQAPVDLRRERGHLAKAMRSNYRLLGMRLDITADLSALAS